MVKIDARGISCPQPVLMTKKVLDTQPELVEIIVDNNTAKENVERFLKNNKYRVEITQQDQDFTLTGRRS